MRWKETKPLSTYTVDKELIQDMEEYCSQRIPKILNIKKPVVNHVSINVRSNEGEYEYSTIQDFKNSFFQSNTRSITIEFCFYDKSEGIVLTTRFDKNSEKSYIDLCIYNDTPEETLAAIRHGLINRMNDKKNSNRYFYPKEFVLFPVLVLGLIIGLGGILSDLKDLRLVSIIFLAFLLIYIGFFRFLVGYCTFNSKRQKRIERVTKWFILGIAGFLLSALLTPLRKIIFGF